MERAICIETGDIKLAVKPKASWQILRVECRIAKLKSPEAFLSRPGKVLGKSGTFLVIPVLFRHPL